MKKFSIFFILTLAALVSCNKEGTAPDAIASGAGDAVPEAEIVIGCADSFSADVATTKATAVTSLPSSLYWGATTGTLGSETVKWSSASGTVSAGKISTGKYQTASPTTYNYYVSNLNMSVGTSATTVSASNTTDVICGKASSNSTTPSVTLDHIFARTGTLTCNTQSGYSISNVSWTIVGTSTINGTAGTYNMTTNAWTAASTKLTSDTAITSSSDMYLIPGTYTIKVTYTLTKGDYSQTFTKSASVSLTQGYINNITVTAIGGASTEIVLSVSLSAWQTQTLTPSLS